MRRRDFLGASSGLLAMLALAPRGFAKESTRIDDSVDLVANDSGGAVAQLFLAKHPRRVRTLLLTNCDVDENSPPPHFLPFIEMAKKGKELNP